VAPHYLHCHFGSPLWSLPLHSFQGTLSTVRPMTPCFAGDSVKNSVDNEGVLGVRWNGDMGKRKLLFDAPGLARPACSFCSSVQLSSAAINCRIWNFLGSERSRARKCKKWFVTICLLTVSNLQSIRASEWLPVNVVLWFSLLEKSQGFREVVIEHNCFMP